ncbi:MAG TPA: hypothetical protein DEF51_21420 [Myxococcales bacterium]|nr:hypothetical protein [Myxococcales bacterium]
MRARAMAAVGWMVAGGAGLLLCPPLWAWLTAQPTSSCDGLGDGVSSSRLVLFPLEMLARDASSWPCVVPALAPPLVGLGLVLRRPRGWGWLLVAGGWLTYAVMAVLLAGVGC